MKRLVTLLSIAIQTESPVSIAVPEAAQIKGVDLPTAREPFKGQPYVPTSSLLGSLRDHVERALGHEECLRLLGGDVGGQLSPSALRALGTSISLDESVELNKSVELRRQTAIDRRTASARKRSLRSREVLKAGAQVVLYLVMRGQPDDQLRGAITTWRPVLGGGRSGGLGDARVQECRVRTLDLATTEGLTEWLALGGPKTWDVGKWQKWQPKLTGTERQFSMKFELDGDLMVGNGEVLPDRAAATMRSEGQPVLPGTSIKGVFRSRAEFILRTLGARACLSTESACKSDPCLTCQVFGHAGSGDESPGRRSRLRFSQSIVSRAETDKRAHVAIDRFTGGQSHGLLFSQEVVTKGVVEIRVSLDDDDLADVAEALLAAVALDIDDGYVGFGHGTARGMGSLRLAGGEAERCRTVWGERRAKVLEAAR